LTLRGHNSTGQPSPKPGGVKPELQVRVGDFWCGQQLCPCGASLARDTLQLLTRPFMANFRKADHPDPRSATHLKM